MIEKEAEYKSRVIKGSEQYEYYVKEGQEQCVRLSSECKMKVR